MKGLAVAQSSRANNKLAHLMTNLCKFINGGYSALFVGFGGF